MSDIREIAKLIKQREKFKRDNPLFFVHLNNPQRRLMDVTSDIRKDRLPRRLLFVGPNKVGKTAGGVLRGICLALGEHPFLPDDHPLRKVPNWPLPNVGLVVGEQLTQAIDKKLVPEYMHWIPRICRPETKKNAQGVIVRITLHNDLYGKPLGSVVHFRSMDMDPETFEGIDQNWLHWDEPPPYKHFVSAERGLLPSDGVSYMTFTSLKEPWIKDFADASIDYGGSDRGTRVVEAGDIWQNSVAKGGFLTDEAIAEFVKIVPKEEYPARVMGQWMQSGSVIYSSFRDDEPYVVPSFDVPRHWTRVESVDPHDAKPTRWLFCAVSPYEIDIDDEVLNRIFVIDYLSLHSSMTIMEMAQAVRKKRLDLGYGDRGPYVIMLDAKYGRKRTVTMTADEPMTWEEKLTDVGIGYIELSHSKPGSVELGHKITRDYLRPQYFKIAEKDMPGLVFFDRCRGMDGPIESMRKYRYKIGTDQPEEDYKDWADTVRYVSLFKPKHMDVERMKRDFQPRDRYAGR